MADNKVKLFADFPPVTTEEWKEKVIADLKGADFEKKLVWRTTEGFNVQPMYRREDIEGLTVTDSLPGQFPYTRGTKADNDWYIRQDIEVTSAKEANEKALDILNKGVNSLGFHISKKILSPETIEILLKDICAECIELNFSTCVSTSKELVKLLVEYFQKSKCDLSKLNISVEFNPIKKILVKGKKLDNTIWNDYAEVIALAKPIKNMRVIAVNPVVLCDAGAYLFEELGYAMAWGNDVLAHLTELGLDASEVASRMKFNFGVSGNYFMEIAKFRAARMLWAKIVEAYNTSADAQKINIHASTSTWNMTVYDAYVNLLRSQTESMSATIAGVDSLTVTPFDNSYKKSDEFSERLARNQQLLLKEESHFDKVVDPAAGSYYVETLTVSIAEQAWKLFLSVEEKGGFVAIANEGEVQKAINATAKARREAMARRKEILLGTNQFPNFNEFAKDKIEKDENCGCGCSCEPEIEKLDFSRKASDFEAVRLQTEKSGKRPKVFMLTIGNLAMRLARAQFSSNFFACAGYEIIDNLGFKTPEEGVAAAQKVGADIIVLCSSDDEYAELAPITFEAIGGKQLFVVAGAPECMEDLKAKGIEYFINVRSNVLETLKMFNSKLIG